MQHHCMLILIQQWSPMGAHRSLYSVLISSTSRRPGQQALKDANVVRITSEEQTLGSSLQYPHKTRANKDIKLWDTTSDSIYCFPFIKEIALFFILIIHFEQLRVEQQSRVYTSEQPHSKNIFDHYTVDKNFNMKVNIPLPSLSVHN